MIRTLVMGAMSLTMGFCLTACDAPEPAPPPGETSGDAARPYVRDVLGAADQPRGVIEANVDGQHIAYQERGITANAYMPHNTSLSAAAEPRGAGWSIIILEDVRKPDLPARAEQFIVSLEREDGEYRGMISELRNTTFDLTITSVEDGRVKGTFAGTMYGPADKTLTVTDGRFDVPARGLD